MLADARPSCYLSYFLFFLPLLPTKQSRQVFHYFSGRPLSTKIRMLSYEKKTYCKSNAPAIRLPRKRCDPFHTICTMQTYVWTLILRPSDYSSHNFIVLVDLRLLRFSRARAHTTSGCFLKANLFSRGFFFFFL